MVLSLVLAVLWLRNLSQMRWTVQAKIMLFFLAMGGLWTPIARNNFWAYHTTFDLAIQFFCYMFPVITFMSNGRGLRAMINVLTFIGVYLALYAALHAGVGPGGFASDENDVCLLIIMMLAFPLSMAIFEKRAFRKAMLVLASLIMLGGIVSTMSRGGFIGVLVMFGYLFLKMRSKIPALLIMFIIGLVGLALIPESYWTEMGTISTSESTAQERLYMWGVALKIWFNPEHFTFGVGPMNTQWWIKDYESVIAASAFGKSVAGRAVHSMYVQLLVDLGIVGLLMFLSMAYKSYRLNQATRIEADRLGDRVAKGYENVAGLYREEGVERLPIDNESVGSRAALSPKELQEIELLERTLMGAHTETTFIYAFAVAVNASWLGVLSAGVFISIFYYPAIWTLGALSGALLVYRTDLFETLTPLLDKADPQGAVEAIEDARSELRD